MSLPIRFALALLAVPSLASANLMTFDGIPYRDHRTNEWTEDGITATGTIGSWSVLDAAYVSESGNAFFDRVTFVTGSVFEPLDVMIRPGGTAFCAGACEDRIYDDIYEYIWLEGSLGGVTTGTFTAYRPASLDFELFSLSFLGPIDQLLIGVASARRMGLGKCLGDFGCGQLDIDNLRVSVPEPATLLLLGAGLPLLLRRRRAAR